MTWSIEFPAHFRDNPWQVEAKGYLEDLVIHRHDRELRLTVYDPVRLAQDIAVDLESSSPSAFSNLLVVAAVTENQIREALDLFLGSEGYGPWLPHQ